MIGGEKSEKSGYSLYKTLILLKVHTNNPNNRDFRSKNIQWSVLQAEYTENSGIVDEIFPKNRKISQLLV